MVTILNQLAAPYRTIFQNIYASINNILFFSFNGKKIFSNTSEFTNHELVKSGNEIKEKHINFIQKSNLRKDVYLIEYPHPMCFAIGYQLHFTKNSHAAIFMSQGLFELDENAFSFLLKHEISHIKFCDVLMRPIVSLLCLTICACAASHFISIWTLIYISFGLIPLTNHFLGGLWMRYRENRADAFAMKHSNIEELKGAVRYFSAIKKYNASLSHSHPQYTRDGELSNGFHYPKTSSRIKRFLKEIKKRTQLVYEVENDYIDKHINLLQTNDDKLKAIIAFQG